MKKSTKSRTKVRYSCPDCGSVVHRDIIESVVMEHCSNDLLPRYALQFEQFQAMDDLKKAEVMSKWDDLKSGLYAQWYISTQDITQPFECTWKVDPRAKLITPSKCTMTLPDMAQNMIASWILKRPLTEKELTGELNIPTISEEGIHGEGQIEYIVFPKDVTPAYKDLFEKYNSEPTIVLFNKDKL
jgi:hypothetical protein